VAVSLLIRVFAAAFALSTLSFAAGVAGDLSPPPASGTVVVLRLPPALPAPALAPEPAPAPALLRTTAAGSRIPAAAPVLVTEALPVTAPVFVAEAKLTHELAHSVPKPQPDLAQLAPRKPV